jgi:septum formation protein
MQQKQQLVLASRSAIRRRILTDAGIHHKVTASSVDEDGIKAQMKGAAIGKIAQALADAKALDVAQYENGLVIGADQIMALEDNMYDKAKTLPEARERLRQLRGRTHQLIGAISLARNGTILERHISISTLKMRQFTDRFLDEYLELEGENILSSVGCYRLEGPGAQLFERLEGDYFSILGLDLTWLSARLRHHQVLST